MKISAIRTSMNMLAKFILVFMSILATSALAQQAQNQLRGGEIQSFAEHQYGKVEVRIYSQPVTGTTSTFFWWRNGGHECGTQWNELDIETIPVRGQYQSNPIWQTSDNDCQIKRSEELHGDASMYNRWVVYTLEWTPNYIAWYHDGQLDRRIDISNHPSVNYIRHAMRYCFNLWTQGNANPDWLGNLDFDSLSTKPVYQFVDYFRYYEWNGNGFNSTATTNINFTSSEELYGNFAVSNWSFGQSQGFLSWSPDAVGVVDIGNGNGALWLGLFHAGSERPPNASELPSSSSNTNPGGTITIQAESASNYSGLRVAANNLGYIQNGAWASYASVNIPTTGQYEVSYRASSGGDGGTIQLERAGGSTVYGDVSIPATGSWGSYRETKHTVRLEAGNISFGLYFADGGFNLDRITIKAAEPSPVGPTRTIEAENAVAYDGLRVSTRNLGYISNGAWASFAPINIDTAGQYRITYRVSSGGDGGSIQLERAGGGLIFGNINVPATGTWGNYTNVSHVVNLPRGSLSFGMYFEDGGFNLDKFSIVRLE